MRAWIEVENRKEGQAIQAGLSDPSVKAFVVVVGVLNTLPTDRARARVLRYVADQLADQTPVLAEKAEQK